MSTSLGAVPNNPLTSQYITMAPLCWVPLAAVACAFVSSSSRTLSPSESNPSAIAPKSLTSIPVSIARPSVLEDPCVCAEMYAIPDDASTVAVVLVPPAISTATVPVRVKGVPTWIVGIK